MNEPVVQRELRRDRVAVVAIALCLALFGLLRVARHVARRVTPPPAQAIAAPVPPPKPKPHGAFPSAVVLCYHRLADSPARETVLSPKAFAAQLAWLGEHGYKVIRLTELAEALANHESVPGKSVVLTFDDGFSTDYSVLFPLLKQYNIPATLFVYTKWVSHARGADTWAQLREMVASKLVEVQSHTVSHADLQAASNAHGGGDKLDFELRTSKSEIEAELKTPVTILAYPYGRIDRTVEQATRAAGYQAALIVNGKAIDGDEDLLRLGRRMVFRSDSLTKFASRVANRPLGLRGSAPLPDEPQTDAQPEIRAELAEGLKPTLSALHIDGKLVPSRLDPATQTLTGRPESPLAPGKHAVLVSVVDGGVAMRRGWAINIVAPAAARAAGEGKTKE